MRSGKNDWGPCHSPHRARQLPQGRGVLAFAWRKAGPRSSVPSPMTQIELAYLGGATARVGAADTAFGDRRSPFVINLLGNWSEASEDVSNVSWVRSLFRALRPAMTPGVYINFMSGDEEDRVPEAYRERWARLVTVKSHYDPGNFFRLNQNIPPQQTGEERPALR